MESKEIKKIALTVLGQTVDVVNYLPENFFRQSILATPYILSEGCKGLIIRSDKTIEEATTFSPNSKEFVKDVLSSLNTRPGDILVWKQWKTSPNESFAYQRWFAKEL